MQRMLAQNGLGKDDYDLAVVGGTAARATAIMSGGTSAGLVGPPQSFQLLGQGLRSLGLSTQYYKDYQFDTLVVRKDWAQQNEDVVLRYLKAMSAAVDWFYDPANCAEAARILAQETNIAPDLAEQTWDLLPKRRSSPARRRSTWRATGWCCKSKSMPAWSRPPMQTSTAWWT